MEVAPADLTSFGLAEFLEAALRFAEVSSISIGGLFVVGGPFHFSEDAFALTQFFEPSHELLDGFIGTGANLDHVLSGLSFRTLKFLELTIQPRHRDRCLAQSTPV